MLKRGTRDGLGAPPSGGPAQPETRARHHCPVCQNDQTAPAEHVIISRWVVVEEEYRCAACEGLFWVLADGARPNARGSRPAPRVAEPMLARR
jgi:hypothetical protein